jgi:Transposase DDE domain
MSSIPQVCKSLRTVFEEDAPRLARKHGLRQRLFTSSSLAYTLVLGWLLDPKAGSSALARFAGSLGVKVQRQHIEAHFTERTAAWLQEVVQHAIGQVISAPQAVAIPLLSRFAAVWMEDSSTVSLPAALREVWRGCGGNSQESPAPMTEAGLKLMVRWNLKEGTLQGPFLHSARTHDRHSALAEQPMPAGSLWIGDLGYFALYWLAHLRDAGIFFLIRWKEPITVWMQGVRVDLLDLLPHDGDCPLDCQVSLGADQGVPVRLLAWRVPDEVLTQRHARIGETARLHQKPVQERALALARWTIVVTSVPENLLSVPEASALLRARWQIELLFKLWKQQCLLDEWRTSNPQRILCEVYAKLLGVLVQHWLSLLSCWDDPHRSLTSVASVIRQQVPLLVHGLCGRLSLRKALRLIVETVRGQCSIPARQDRPSTSRLLLGSPVWGLT